MTNGIWDAAGHFSSAGALQRKGVDIEQKEGKKTGVTLLHSSLDSCHRMLLSGAPISVVMQQPSALLNRGPGRRGGSKGRVHG